MKAKIVFVFGIFLAIMAFIFFPSESSWGGIVSLIGAVISLIGFIFLTKNSNYHHRFFFNFLYFVVFMGLLMGTDYLMVKSFQEAPRFATVKVKHLNAWYYDTPFYDVINCSKKDYNILKNTKYSEELVEKTCQITKLDEVN